MPPLFEELKKTLEGECTADFDAILRASNDASPYSVRPQAVVFPKTTSDIKKCVLFAKKYSIPLTVRGLGKGTRGACLTDGFVVDMSRYFDKMDHLVLLHSNVTIQAGMNFKECSARLASWGYTLPFAEDTASDMSIGGMFANAYRDGASLFHGGITDWVTSLRVILDDGEEYVIKEGVAPTGRLLEIYSELLLFLKEQAPVFRARRPHVSDHSMGYDVFTTHISPKVLMHVLAGSQGTLGIITEITFRLTLKDVHKSGIALRVQTLHDLPALREMILKTHPIALYGFSTSALLYSQKTQHSLLLNKHEKDQFTLFAIYEEKKSTPLIENKALAEYKKLTIPVDQKYVLDAESIALYMRVVYSQKYALEKYSGNTLTAMSLCDDIVIPSDEYVMALREVSGACEELGLMYSIVGDIGNNMISAVPLVNLTKEESLDTVIELLTRVGHIVKQYHGSMSFKEGDGLTNTPLIPLILGDQISKRLHIIKEIWDPSNIFNTGKKTTVDFTYLKKHIKHTRG